jgi:hypothetical protein
LDSEVMKEAEREEMRKSVKLVAFKRRKVEQNSEVCLSFTYSEKRQWNNREMEWKSRDAGRRSEGMEWGENELIGLDWIDRPGQDQDIRMVNGWARA